MLTVALSLGAGCDPAVSGTGSARAPAEIGAPAPAHTQALAPEQRAGRKLFRAETFDGNGRTCETCHSRQTGTLSVDDVQRRFHNPNDELFRAIDSDRGSDGDTFERLLTHATVLLPIEMHEDVSIVGSDARVFTVARGIPTTMNTPALDPVLMYDGRHPNLEAQALGAVFDHAQPGRTPTETELARIADFQTTLFNRDVLEDFASGGPPPELPRGNTPSEIRGRRFFVVDGFEVGLHPDNLCTHCHGGPFLNQSTGFLPFLPAGARFANVRVSEFNTIVNPVYQFEFHDGLPPVESPDIGLALVTGRRADVNLFKITTMWGIEETAPYFHDNSAKTLAQMVAHYDRFFDEVTNGAVRLTPRDQADIVAYLKLL